jgi:hypothetical protein
MGQSISLIELQRHLQNIPPSELSSPKEIKLAINQIAKEMNQSLREVEVKDIFYVMIVNVMKYNV